jgi:hypothetical protein
MQAKLVADLEEIDLLLNEYSINKILNIHPKQKYKKQWFQGNPIYLIRVNESLTKIDKKKFTLSKYNFTKSNNDDKKILLFRKDDAYKVWELYRLKNTELNLPEKPSLEIYNLENYLLDLEKSDVSLTQQTTFVPPYDSYIYSKKLIEQSQLKKKESFVEKVDKYVTAQAKSLQRFYKGVIWLVTSDTLPSEENSW